MTPEEIKERLQDKSTWANGYCLDDERWPIEIVAYFPNSTSFIAGLCILSKDQNFLHPFNVDGVLHESADKHRIVPRPVKLRRFVNINPVDIDGNAPGCIHMYLSRSRADEFAEHARIACIEIEFTEGEGL